MPPHGNIPSTKLQPPQRGPEKHVQRQRAILVREGNRVLLTDLDTAAYLHGVHLLGVHSVEKVAPSCHEIWLYDPEGRADQLAVDFINSECVLFADGMKRMKKIIHSFGGKNRRRKR